MVIALFARAHKLSAIFAHFRPFRRGIKLVNKAMKNILWNYWMQILFPHIGLNFFANSQTVVKFDNKRRNVDLEISCFVDHNNSQTCCTCVEITHQWNCFHWNESIFCLFWFFVQFYFLCQTKGNKGKRFFMLVTVVWIDCIKVIYFCQFVAKM